MKRVFNTFYLVTVLMIACCALLSSCNEPSLVGEDFINDDIVDVQYSDTFQVLARPIRIDDVTVFDRSSNIQVGYGVVGILDEPNFGRADYSVYVQYRTFNAITENDGFVVDSVVLQMKYDTIYFFGDSLSKLHEIDVHRIVENFDADNGVYTAKQSLMTDPMPLGSTPRFDAKPKRPYRLVDFEGDTITFDPQLRIRLDNALGEELLSLDSIDLVSDSLFTDAFQGLHILPKAVSQELLGFQFTDLLNSGVTVYYRVPDTSVTGFKGRQLELVTTDFRALAQHIERDRSGSLEQTLYDDQNDIDSLVFIEGLEGPEVEIEFPNIRDLENVLVLKAELEIRAVEINGLNYDEFQPVSLIRTSYFNDDDDLVPTDEYAEAFGSNPVPGLFGGFVDKVESDTMPDFVRYTFNVSRTIQQMIDGEQPTKLRLNAQPRVINARRSILYGTTGKIPMKLRITYTTNN
jgi:predicted small secreted protein